jgi:hypothetical protein
MLCIDKVDRMNETIDLKLYGPNENSPHRMIELMFRPRKCDVKSEDCAKVLDDIKEKIGMPNFLFITN